jgi:hypothetical protein
MTCYVVTATTKGAPIYRHIKNLPAGVVKIDDIDGTWELYRNIWVNTEHQIPLNLKLSKQFSKYILYNAVYLYTKRQSTLKKSMAAFSTICIKQTNKKATTFKITTDNPAESSNAIQNPTVDIVESSDSDTSSESDMETYAANPPPIIDEASM